MDKCNEGCDEISNYLIVRTLSDRNTIPCIKRINGMKVTVIGDDFSYKEYMLQGGDPCVNSNWKENFSSAIVSTTIGHVTVEEVITSEITDLYLNQRFPKALEGFRVTFITLNSTFSKVSGDRWAITINTLRNNG